MSERSIILKAPHVQALLRGATQLRLPMKPQPNESFSQRYVDNEPTERTSYGWSWQKTPMNQVWPCPSQNMIRYGAPYQPGDVLLVKETWQFADWTPEGEPYIRYKADGARQIAWTDEPLDDVWASLSAPENYNIDFTAADRRWRSPVTMPKWAVRLKPVVKSVQVQRLHDISEAEADACGTLPCPPDGGDQPCPVEELFRPYACGLAKGWDDLYGDKHPWASNCWCWVYELEPQPCES